MCSSDLGEPLQVAGLEHGPILPGPRERRKEAPHPQGARLAPMDRRLLALLSGVLLGTVSESSLAPALPVLERAFAVGPEAAQGVVSLGLLGAALAYLPLAGLAGRVGAGRLFRTGLFLHALSALLLALAPSLWALYLLRLLQGVATAMVVGLVPGLAEIGRSHV